MKNPINKLPGSELRKGSKQCYSSVKQQSSKLSVFIAPHPADALSEQNGGPTSLTPKYGTKFVGPCTGQDIWLNQIPKNTIRFNEFMKKLKSWAIFSNVQVLRPTMETVLWLARSLSVPKLQPVANCSVLFSGQFKLKTMRDEKKVTWDLWPWKQYSFQHPATHNTNIS